MLWMKFLLRWFEFSTFQIRCIGIASGCWYIASKVLPDFAKFVINSIVLDFWFVSNFWKILYYNNSNYRYVFTINCRKLQALIKKNFFYNLKKKEMGFEDKIDYDIIFEIPRFPINCSIVTKEMLRLSYPFSI